MVPESNLNILFWVDPPTGRIILEKLKNPKFAHMALDGGRNCFAVPFRASFAQLLEDGKSIQIQFYFSFTVFFGKFGYLLIGRAERGKSRASQPTGAKQLAPFFYTTFRNRVLGASVGNLKP